MKKILSLFLGLIFFCGLYQQKAWAGQTTWPPEYRVKVTTKVYKFDYDLVFNAALAVCGNNTYTVLIQNRQSGVIMTDYQTAGDIAAGRARVRFTFNISKTPDGATRLAINIHCEDSYLHGGTQTADTYIDEAAYRDFFKSVDKALEQLTSSKTETQPGFGLGQPSSSSGSGPVLRF
ncbi:MAG: hypothetical protein WC628_04755 [Candidatus Omnitrophota bacterium]